MLESNTLFSSASMLPVEEQSIRVWFATRELCFTRQALEGYHTLRIASLQDISKAKIITFLENYNRVALLWSEPLQAFECFAREMKCVEAAGGVVQNEQGDVVMIRRNERWDLPKGHREQGESMAQCAAREAEEETGVTVKSVERLLTTTLHAYNTYGRWELKLTAWYAMRADSVELRPQREEGIICAEWVARDVIKQRIKSSFPTIKRVFDSFL